MDDHELVARILRERVEHLPDDVAEKICFEVSDEILAALAKAGRLASEVKGDVVEAAARAMDLHWRKTSKPWPGGADHEWTWSTFVPQVEAVAGIIAADAERRVLEKAELAIRQCASIDGNGYFCEKAKAIAAIRALLTPSPAAQPGGER